MTKKSGCESLNGSLKESCDKSRDRYLEYQFKDPFSDEILPTLLSPEDLKKYIDKAGIIFPYDEKNLRTPTYKVPLHGDIYYWNDKNKRIKTELPLSRKDVFVEIQPNSVTYVHISTIFRVPYYLAFRFNLTVSLAHKGLLLGTGPIIDPGFEGRIMIPIHNLTDNIYELQAGSGFIKVEITKLSNYKELSYDSQKTYEYKFLDKYKHLSADEYFSEINKNNPIKSSLSGAIRKSQEVAKAASKSAEEAHEAASKSADEAREAKLETENKIRKIERIITFGGVTALIGVGIAMVALILQTFSTIDSITGKVDTKTETNEEEIENNDSEIDKINKKIDKLKKLIDKNENKQN